MNDPTARYRKLSILMAAYNEECTLRRCLEQILAAPLPGGLDREIILVDDGSTDHTWEIAQRLSQQHPWLRVFQQPVNQGKGAAIRRAIREMSGDIAIFQDADLEYEPRDYGRLLRPILEGKADVVYGSRFTGEERKVLFFWHTLGNRGLTFLSNLLNNLNLTDMESCYKAFTTRCLRTIPLESNRFGIEPEITTKVARNRFRIYEVPIAYNGRTYEEGKKIGWRDGVAALWFSKFDQQIGHFRRYQKGELEKKMQAAGFQIERQLFFNKVGVVAWWVANTLAGQRTITSWQLRLYNLLTPLFRILDGVLPISGLSTIVVARKPKETPRAA